MRVLVAALIVSLFLAMPFIGHAADRSMQEGVRQAQVRVGWLEAMSQALGQLLDKARKERDLKKISCIEPHLVDIERVLQDARARLSKLQQAVSQNDAETYESESLAIENLRIKGERIRRLVEECLVRIGAPEGYTEVMLELGEEGEKAEVGEAGSDPENWPEPVPPDYEAPEEVSPDQDED